MSLFYSYIAGSLHVSSPQADLQESSYSCSHNHWFSFCAALFACYVWHRNWTNGCVSSCTNSPEDGPVGPKHVEIQQYTNKIATSVGFHSICWKDARYKKLKIYYLLRDYCDILSPSFYLLFFFSLFISSNENDNSIENENEFFFSRKFHIYWSVLLQFGIRNLHIMLLNIYELCPNRLRENIYFLSAQMKLRLQ